MDYFTPSVILFSQQPGGPNTRIPSLLKHMEDK